MTSAGVSMARSPDEGAVAPARSRSMLRAVAVPSEHGGWGLTLEPVVLGLVVEPTTAGLCVGVAALLAFLVRTPLKVVLVDAHRRRALPRTRIAGLVVIAEGLALTVL